ncbi:helix-turn-helix domain-containing protein [Hoeflea sp. WL0058]|uniref:Helix-turn-helix domain-containing protein n=1 Tax=Flavimaribacter sediminis TaxID=2865987 RepID=A0AAE2ZM41_9HYPH|nr:helix-turn-helix domain-containing protein [Flavimaribacter sediminis]
MFSLLDVLSSVGRDWEYLHGVEPGEAVVFEPSLRTANGAPYWDINGRKITPDAAFHEDPAPDLVIVPDIHVDFSGPLPPDLLEAADWIAETHAGGALTTSVCSGALVLGASGVLDGNDATTHWGVADTLANRHRSVRVRRERVLVPAGEGHRVVTAGGASAWSDLLLYLIARLAGLEAARRIAKVWLLTTHDEGQLTYASLTAGRQHDDKLVADAQAFAANCYMDATPVAGMVARSGLSERGFLRRFRRATGQSPAEYVQTVRVEEAKQLLETTDAPIDDIAEEVGYSEPSSFRAAFRRNVGISASVYRRKWRSLSPAAVH